MCRASRGHPLIITKLDPLEEPMRIYKLKQTTIPKVAVLATGLAAALLVATIHPQAAQATPRASNCTGCHAGATTTTVGAIPSTATPAPGASYTVAISLTANPLGGMTGYGIVPVAPAIEKTFGGNTGSELSFSATMIAPAAAGTYSYTVWTSQGSTDGSGQVGSKVYAITVAPVVTVPPTTVAPTVPPTTVAPTVPPTTVAPTVPPTTVAPTVPPTTVAPTVPPTTVAPTVPPTTVAPTVPPTTVAPTVPDLAPTCADHCGSHCAADDWR